MTSNHDSGDFERINDALRDLFERSGANAVLLVDRAGYLIAQAGNTTDFDATVVATLSANAFNATQFLVDLLPEPNLSTLYQQGSHRSIIWVPIGEDNLLVIFFAAKEDVNSLRSFAVRTAKTIADLLI